MNTFVVNAASIDSSRVSRAIYAYQSSEGRDPSYLVMNSDTKKALEATLECIVNKVVESPKYATYMGVPIAICENHKFGDVELV